MLGYGFNNNGTIDLWSELSNYTTLDQLNELLKLPLPTGKVLQLSDTGEDLTNDFTTLKILLTGHSDFYNLPSNVISNFNKVIRKINKLGLENVKIIDSEILNSTFTPEDFVKIITRHNTTDYIQNRNATKNSVVSGISQIIKSPSNQILANIPVDVQQYHDAIAKYAPNKGTELLNSYDVVSFFEQQYNASVGKDDVGIFANGMKTFFALTDYYNDFFKNWIPNKEAEISVLKENINPEVSELFESNPELANEVYEALGFGKDGNYYEGNINPEPNTIFVFGSNPEGRHGLGAAKVAREQFGAVYGQGEGLQGNAYALPTKDLKVKENRGFKSISPEQITNSIKKLYETAKQNPNKQFKVAYRNTTDTSLNGYTGLEMIEMFNQAGTIPSNVIFSKEWVDTNKLNIKRQITPQQKQQAQQLYSQYLDTINNPTIEGFKEFVSSINNKEIKEDVSTNKLEISKLFDSNPELANAIYEALGINNIIKPDDKIVWGHPAIGKTTMLESNPNAFIDWDNEFNTKRDNWIASKSNTKIGTPEFKKARNEYMINYNNHKDYVAFVKKEWNKAKEKANKENKTLIASPHMLLNLFPNDFDKVITMSDETFMDRAIKRSGGDEVNSKLWKEGINETLQSIDKSKIIETDKFINDLFISPQQKQQAQQLYSQYLESLNKPNTNPVLQGNQEEQVKKFAELQERLNNKEFLEGAKNAYESSKGLQEWGTQEQYNDYIARVSLGIVKNPSSGEYNYVSKVKDIVYHGTVHNFDKFVNRASFYTKIEDIKKNTLHFARAIFSFVNDLEFTSNKEQEAHYNKIKELGYNVPPFNIFKRLIPILYELEGKRNYQDVKERLNHHFSKEEIEEYFYPHTVYAIINTKNPLYTDKPVNDNLTVTDSDSIIGYEERYGSKSAFKEISVFDPEQIHILGSKQDIEGFKRFVDNTESIPSISEEGIRFLPLKGNEEIYKKYNLLSNNGKIKQVPNNKKTEKWLETLNKSNNFQFRLRPISDGTYRILIIHPYSQYAPAISEDYITPIKQGVDFVFKENPELNNIGTQQLYSQYLEQNPNGNIEGFKEFVIEEESTRQKRGIDLNESNDINYKLFNKTFTFTNINEDGTVGEDVVFNFNTISDIQISRAQSSFIRGFYPLFTKKSSNAALILSGGVSSATDNAKELIMAKINASAELAAMHVHMMILGFNLDEIVKILTSDVMNDLVSRLETNIYGERKKSVDNVFETMINEYGKDHPQIKTLQSLYQIFLDAKETTELSRILGVNQKRKANTWELYNFLNKFRKVIKMQEDNFFVSKDETDVRINKIIEKTGINRDIVSSIVNTATDLKISGDDFNFELYQSDPEYKKAVKDYYNLIKSTFNIFDVIDNVPHFKQMIEGVQLSHRVLKNTSAKYNFIFDYLPVEGTNSIQKLRKGSRYFDVKTIQGWLRTDNMNKYVFNVGQLLKVAQSIGANVNSVTLYTDNKAVNDDAFTEVVTQDSDFNVSLDTDYGVANFKVLMEEVMLPILNKVSDVGSLLRTETLKNVFGLLSTTIVSMHQLKYLNNPISIGRFQELLNKFNELDENINSRNRIQNTFGENLRWRDLFYIYNLLVNNELYGDKRLTPLFRDYSKESNSLQNDYLNYVSLFDSGKLDIFNIDLVDSPEYVNASEDIREELREKHNELIRSNVDFYINNKEGVNSTVSNIKSFLSKVTNPNFVLVTNGVESPSYVNVTREMENILKYIKLNGFIIDYNC